MSNPYSMMKPCPQCPFRSDIRPYLTESRVREIERALERSEFSCHKTTSFDDDGEHTPTPDEAHCAGALILMEKEGRSSQMMRVAERLGLYDHTKLDMSAPVYDTFDDMADAQPE